MSCAHEGGRFCMVAFWFTVVVNKSRASAALWVLTLSRELGWITSLFGQLLGCPMGNLGPRLTVVRLHYPRPPARSPARPPNRSPAVPPGRPPACPHAHPLASSPARPPARSPARLPARPLARPPVHSLVRAPAHSPVRRPFF